MIHLCAMTAKEVKDARTKLGLTQFEFAKKMRRTARTVIKWEDTGIKKISDAARLTKLLSSFK